MKLIKPVLICLIPILLADCAGITSPLRQKDYLEAKSIPPLKIPPGTSSSAFRNDYPVSDHDFPGNKDMSLIPPGLSSN